MAGRADSARREALVDAAFKTLREQGFAHASARAIAAEAGCNSALVFYYFGSVNALLVEALAQSSRSQLDKYEEALAAVSRLDELVAVVQQRVRDDRASGHVKVLTELLGASSSDQALRAAVHAEVGPWLRFTERTLERVLTASGIPGLVPADQISFVVVSLFLGMELLSDVADDTGMIDRSLDSARQLTSLLPKVSLAAETDPEAQP